MEVIELLGWPLFLFGSIVVFVGASVQGATGLGFGLIVAPVLMILEPAFVPGPVLVLAMVVSLMIAVRERHHIDWHGLLVILGGRFLGTVLAAMTLTVIPLELYKLTFGCLILLAVYLKFSGLHTPSTAPYLVGAGLASGYMGTLTSVGAPPVALAYQQRPPHIIRSTLSMFFLIGTALSVLVIWMFGDFTFQEAKLGIGFAPALIGGFVASRWLISKSNSSHIQNAILGLSALSAVILIAMALVTYL